MTGVEGQAAPLGRPEFQAIASMMMDEARIGMSEAKLGMVQSRLSKRLRATGLASFGDYVRLVRSDPHERAVMVTSLTTNHTSFFREKHHFDHVCTALLPRLQAKAQRGEAVRLWSAGCSSGEEVYSLAMCLLGLDRASATWLRGRDVRLLATDIAPPMVAAVQQAHYSAEAVVPVPAPYRACWTRSAGDGVVMAEDVRRLVTARVLNLFAEWPLSQRYDAIFCRNVMIYFDDPAKAELCDRLAERLVPGGFLYIGHSERLLGKAASAMQPCGQTIYVKGGQA